MSTDYSHLPPKVALICRSLELALENIQGIADGTDIPSTAVREHGKAALDDIRNWQPALKKARGESTEGK